MKSDLKMELMYVSKRINSFVVGIESIDTNNNQLRSLLKHFNRIKELLEKACESKVEQGSLIKCFHLRQDLASELNSVKKKLLSTKCKKECKKLGISLNELIEEIEEIVKEIGIYLNANIGRIKTI